jgi:hypothetical protein
MSENEVLSGGRLFTKLSVPGASILTEPGRPELPSITRIAEVPAGARITAELVEEESVVLDGYSILYHQVTCDNGEETPF